MPHYMPVEASDRSARVSAVHTNYYLLFGFSINSIVFGISTVNSINLIKYKWISRQTRYMSFLQIPKSKYLDKASTLIVLLPNVCVLLGYFTE